MSEAWRARDGNGKTVFLKRAREASFEARALQREQNIYEILIRRHIPGVLNVLEFRRHEGFVFLVTDFAEGGSLADFVKKHGGQLSMRDAKAIAKAIARALLGLHQASVVHRDLKPSNVLRSGDEWLLADFGISKDTTRLVTRGTLSMIGTPGYMAPEQRLGIDAAASADVYSFGKVIAFMLSGHSDPDAITQETWWTFARNCTKADCDARPASDRLEALIAELPG
jgi:serine/threonine protein kinase